jgi:malate dehydrogenase (oxaloacetate-decarboxylating)(NADP+)
LSHFQTVLTLSSHAILQGLIVESRKESLQHFKQPWAHEHEPLKTLLEAAESIKPTVLIGTSGVGRTFTKEVVEAMASFNEVSEKFIGTKT